MIIRVSKIFLVVCVSLFALLVGVDNILDYQPNFEAVRHILSMDAIPGDSPLLWRAITNEGAQHAAYWLIIATEIASGLICAQGAFDLSRALTLDGPSFNARKSTATLGLVAIFSLYFLGFMVVGGEWFQMWRSAQWNEQEAAFRFIGCIGLILLFVRQSDADRD
jgi:predicted small integral membrane protein